MSNSFHKLQVATFAARMRHQPTPSEARLWEAIRARRLGVVFRRQVRIGRFVVDFFAPAVGLIVEVDGGYHAARARADMRRDRALVRQGYRVVRISDALVMQHLPVAVERVRRALGVP